MGGPVRTLFHVLQLQSSLASDAVTIAILTVITKPRIVQVARIDWRRLSEEIAIDLPDAKDDSVHCAG